MSFVLMLLVADFWLLGSGYCLLNSQITNKLICSVFAFLSSPVKEDQFWLLVPTFAQSSVVPSTCVRSQSPTPNPFFPMIL